MKGWVTIEGAVMLDNRDSDKRPSGEHLGYETSRIHRFNDYPRFNDGRTYDEACREYRWNAPDVMYQNLIPFLDGHERIIDIGCGSGLSGMPFIDAGFTVDGIDFSRKQLELARARGYRKTTCASAQLPLADLVRERYDALISVGLYGDYVSVSWLTYALSLLKTQAFAGIAGRADELTRVERDEGCYNTQDELKSQGFSILLEEFGEAHKFYIVGNGRHPKDAPLHARMYLYTVAARS